MSDFYTGKGDDGTTGLLGEGRVPKYDPRPNTFGAIDEASAALGLARALAASSESKAVTAQVQRHLYELMAEVASTPENATRFRKIGPEQVEWLESRIQDFAKRVGSPSEFVIAGDSYAGAGFDLARTIVRRAERRLAELVHKGEVKNEALLRYLNRLSSLCYVLALWENKQAGVDQPSLAKGQAD